MHYLWPTDKQINALETAMSGDRPVTMLNLLRYREHADYSGHPNEVACSGSAAYRRYAEHVVPMIDAHGGRLVFAGAAKATVIGPDSDNWDDVLLVEYPSRGAFVAMTTSDDYLAISYHREAALEDSRLLCIVAGAPAYADQ